MRRLLAALWKWRTVLVVNCAWCQRFQWRVKAGDGNFGKSHGICPSCKARMLADEQRRQEAICARLSSGIDGGNNSGNCANVYGAA